VSSIPEALPILTAVRYVTPLREGGSLPAIVETEDAGLFVTKFRGAGQGAKALIAEVIFESLARAIGLPMPEIAIIDMAEDFGRTEPDPEIQDILAGSRGPNFGIRYMDGAMNFDAIAAGALVTEQFATDLVWLDAFLTNPDRSHKNPNLMVWDGGLWLIDHGAALFAHHNWSRVDEKRTRTPFAPTEQHVVLGRSGDLVGADRRLTAILDESALRAAVNRVPDAWLVDPVAGTDFSSPEEARDRYVSYLQTRVAEPRAFVQEAVEAHDRLRNTPPSLLSARR
jgi:hypothetical protein